MHETRLRAPCLLKSIEISWGRVVMIINGRVGCRWSIILVEIGTGIPLAIQRLVDTVES